jgi:RHS repeat-associated protein
VTTADQQSMYDACKDGLAAGDFDGDGAAGMTDYDAYYAYWQEETEEVWRPDEVRVNYAGYIRDGATGLLLARNRWYEPLAGRWTTRDPAGYVDGLDLYLYVRGNPWSLVDPTGLVTDEMLEAKAAMNQKRAEERAAQERAKRAAEAAQMAERHQRYVGAVTDALDRGKINPQQHKNLCYNAICGDNGDLRQSEYHDAIGDDIQNYMVTGIATTVVTAPLGGPAAKFAGKVVGAGAKGVAGLLGREGAEVAGEAAGQAAREVALPIVGDASLVPNQRAAANVLNATLDGVVDDVAANPGMLRTVLSRAEVDAANNGMMAPNVGKGIERLTARALDKDPVHRGLFEYMGGAGQADFVGKGGAFGVQFEVTTFKAFGAHLARPGYQNGVCGALYETPSIIRIP